MPARCSEILIGNVGGVFGDVADQGSHRLTKSGVIECATPRPSRRFALSSERIRQESYGMSRTAKPS